MPGYGRRGGEIVANTQSVGSQMTPSIAGFAAGGFIAVWSTTDAAQDGAGRAIKAQRYDSLGNPVGPEILVNSAAAGDQRAPSVTTLASGGYVVTWETTDAAQDGSGTAIKGQAFDAAGAAVGAEFRVNSQLTADQTKSSVTGLEGGGFVVTWQSADPAQDGHSSAIKGQIYSAAGVAVGAEFLVNTGAVGGESAPSVTSLTGGGFVATWTLGSGQQADIYAQVFSASGAKSGGQFLVNSTNALNQDYASVTELADGRFVVTWSSASSLTTFDTEIRARIFSASGTPIGSDFVVSTARTNPNGGNFVGSTTPQVLDLPDGGFLITWSHGTGDYISSSIRGQYFDAAGARVGAEFLVSTVSDRAESTPDIAMDGNGNMFAVWASANMNFTDYDIRGQVYTMGGAPEIVSNGGGPSAALTVAENQTAVTTIAATDPEGSALTYSIVGGLDASRFAINASTGALTFVQARNFEAKQDYGANNVYDVIVSVSDGVNTDIQALAVTIANVNEGVTLTGGQPNYSYIENGTAPVADFNATDGDGDPVTYSLSGPDAARFTIDAGGVLRFAASPDYEARLDAGANNFYDVTVTASDGSLSSSYTLSVEILNRNEAPYIVSGGGGDSFATTVAENAGFVMTIVTADPDATPSSVTYSIVGGADASKFVVNAQTGQLFFTSGRNFEAPTDAGANNVYDVIVSVSDGFNPADTQAISVTVTNVNEAVTITSNGGGASANIAVVENGLAVTTVAATDPDGTAPTYSIAGGADAALFAIDAATGALRLLAAPDFEAPADAGGNNVYNVIIAASDGILSDTQALAVTVGNANEDIVLAPLGAFSVGENQSAVGAIAATDPDGAALSYAIAGGADAALFAIDAATGALSFVSAPDFEAPADADGNNDYEVAVAASDGSFTRTQIVTVTVGNSDEAVTITSGGGGASSAISVAENGLAVAIVAASDADGTAPSYAIAGGADAALFAIDAATGALSFLSAPDREAPADADGDNVYDVIVSASDGTFTDTQAIAVAVGNVNEGVSINSPASVSTFENGSAVIVVAASDIDGDAVAYAIAGGADASLFEIDAATGALRFVAAPDYETPGDAGGDNVYDVVVSASDGEFSDTRAVAVAVGNANEGVSITSGESFSMIENGTAAGTVTALDVDGTAPTFSIAGGADAALFAIDAATGALSFLSAPDFETPGDAGGDNVYDVVVSASDGEFSDTRALAIAVGNANEGVSITSGTSFSAVENGTAAGPVTALDVDGTAPTFSIAGGADAALFAIDAATGALSFLSAPDFEAPGDADGDNVYDVVVSASDGEFSDTRAVTIAVGNANEGVSITSGASFSVAENGTAAAIVTALDVDGTAPTFSIAGGADAALFAIDASTGALSFLSSPDYEAPGDAGGDNVYDVVVAASDGELSDTRALTVTVGNANDVAPVIAVYGGSVSWTVPENSTTLIDIAATDAEGDIVTYSLTGADAGWFAIDAATGALSWVSPQDFEAWAGNGFQPYHFNVVASDGQWSDTLAVTIGISDVNEGVSIVSNGGGGSAAVTVGENGIAVTAVGAVDEDGTAPAYSIAGGADAALFAIDAATGALRFVAAPDFEAPADADGDNVYEVVVAAGDGSFSDTQTLAVTVADTNEAPSMMSGSFAANENEIAAGYVLASDQDGDALSYAIAGGADAGLFAIDAATGALSFLAPPDYEAPADADGDNVYELVVTAGDGFAIAEQALTVTVGNVDEAVRFTSFGGASAQVSASENQLVGAIVAASDADGGPVTYSIAGGADAAKFAIDAATGALHFLAAPDFEAPGDAGGDNVYDVVVSASDGVFSDSQALAVSVGNVNEGVTITTGGGASSASLSIGENGMAVTIVGATDADGGPVTYAIAGGADAARFTIDAQTGALRFVAAPNFEAPGDAGGDNVYDVIVSASDGMFSDSQALAVSVTNVNEGVTINSGGGGTSAAISVAENGLAVTTIAASDADGSSVTYTIAGGADAARFTIDAATGALRFVAAPNHEAPGDAGGDNVYDVVVSASDGTFSDSQALAVTVTNVREGNVITGNSSNNTISTTTTVTGQARATELEDTIYGMGGADTISGAGGADIIDGGTGNDTITGGLGADVLTGGTGADRFTYTSVAETTAGARDVITDFSRAEADKISLNAIDANSNASGNQNFAFIGMGAFSGVAGQLRYEQSGGKTFVSGDVNGDRAADFTIELTGLVNLISSDFIL